MLSTFELHGEDDSNTTPGYVCELADSARRRSTSHLAWFMSVPLDSRPRCFGCGGRMLPKVVIVQSDFAICEQCTAMDWSKCHPYWLALASLGSPLELSRSRGIIFWTPPATLPDIDAYLRWLELWDIMNPDRRPRRPTHGSPDMAIYNRIMGVHRSHPRP